MENENLLRRYWNGIYALCVRYKRLSKVLMAGVIGLFAQTLVFEVSFQILHLMSASNAVVLGAEAGILTNFYVNNRYSFADRRTKDSVFSRLIRFHVVVSGSVLIQWSLVYVTEHLTNNVYLLHGAFLTGVVVGFLWNYTFYKLLVWRNSAS